MLKTALLFTILSTGLTHADSPSTHGMLIFGDRTTYASHLPMFHAPHDYQLLMQIEFAELPRLAPMVLVQYNQLKAQGEKMFTIEPEAMDLTKVIDGSITSFTAHLYQGHFERGGKDLGPVTVKIKKTLFSKKLNKTEPEKNQYLMFGELGENYYLHLINGKPSFDLVAKANPTRGSQFQTVTLPNKPDTGVIYQEENELAF